MSYTTKTLWIVHNKIFSIFLCAYVTYWLFDQEWNYLYYICNPLMCIFGAVTLYLVYCTFPPRKIKGIANIFLNHTTYSFTNFIRKM